MDLVAFPFPQACFSQLDMLHSSLEYETPPIGLITGKVKAVCTTDAKETQRSDGSGIGPKKVGTEGRRCRNLCCYGQEKGWILLEVKR